MPKIRAFVPPAALTAACALLTPSGSAAAASPGSPSSAAAEAHPVSAPWSGPYGGVPPFAKVAVAHFAPAIARGMDEKRREIAAITDSKAAPTFDDTIAALEDSGRRFADAMTLYGVWSGTMSDDAVRALERELEPKLAAFSDEIFQNARLFACIEAVYAGREKAGLTPEQQRLAWRYFTRFVRAGARLDAPKKARLAEINQRLASLFTTFSQNVLADEEKDVQLLDAAELDGLPEAQRAGAAAAAEARGAKGRFAILNTRSSVEPFLTYARPADAREKVWRRFVNRGDNGDAHDNNRTIAEILKLRAERAKLLGFPTHAHWRLEDSMARTPERALALLEAVWKPAVTRVREEVADMQAIADREAKPGKARPIAPWDYRFYAEKVRKAKYDLDQDEVKPYLQLEKLREGMFWVAGELFGFEFVPVPTSGPGAVEVYHPDVRVWEVRQRAGTGAGAAARHVGLWYFDPYARKGKRSGAWMNAYRDQERFRREVTTLVSNNANFVKPPDGKPVLISWSDARTLFHEFGHALHGLASNVTYPALSGTSVARDYVEFPSQLLENWLSTPEMLGRFALHAETGRPMPAELVVRLTRAETFNQGFQTVEALSAALVDLKLHLSPAETIDPDAFERETLAALGMPPEIVMRHRLPQFGHVFSGDGYSAGYYSYTWADTLSSDAFEAFTEGKGPYDPEVAARLRRHVFSVGDTVDPAEGYRAFRGRDAGVGALMRSRGFQ